MSDVIDRLPPNNPEAEETVIGSILMDPEAIGKVAAFLKPADFYRERNAVVYECALSLHGRREPTDWTCLTDELKRQGRYDEIGGAKYLMDVVGVVPTSAHVEHYARIVQRCRFKRLLISAAGKIAAVGYDETLDTEDTYIKSLELLHGLSCPDMNDTVDGPEDRARHFDQMMEDIRSGKVRGVKTGIALLDHLTGGLKPTFLVTELADTGMGKSALAQCIARYVAHTQGPVLYCSLEMSREQLLRRDAAALLGMDWREFERQWEEGKDLEYLEPYVEEAKKLIRNLPLHTYCRGGMTLEHIRSKALQIQSRRGLVLIVVDYLQLMTPPKSENRTQQIGELSRGLKKLAMDLRVPVLMLCQMHRELTKRTNLRPTLHDARESGSIEQDSDLLLGIYRHDAYYDVGTKLTTEKDRNGEPKVVKAGEAELIVLKSRDSGAPHTIPMFWDAKTVRYAGVQI